MTDLEQEMEEGYILGRCEFYREEGQWHLIVGAPAWVIRDIKRQWWKQGENLKVGNFGSKTMLLLIGRPDRSETCPTEK